MNWWKAHHGISTDPKYQVVLRHLASHGVTERHGLRLSDISAVWVWLIDFASQNSARRGSLEGMHVDHISVATGLPDEAISEIISAMESRGMISGNSLTAFDKRNPSSTVRMRNKRVKGKAKDTASHRVTPRHTQVPVTGSDETPLNLSLSLLTTTTEIGKASSTHSSSVENQNPKKPDADFFDDGDIWFEEIYSRHPKKKDRTLAETLLSELKNLNRQEFDRIHKLWCIEWGKDQPKFAPSLANWISDQGWKYEPNGNSSGASHKSNYPPLPTYEPPED